MVTIFPTIVAIAVLELVYENAPVLVDVGTTNANTGLVKFFVGIEKPDITGVILFTVRTDVIDPDT
jgi:hypothetical protein